MQQYKIQTKNLIGINPIKMEFLQLNPLIRNLLNLTRNFINYDNFELDSNSDFVSTTNIENNKNNEILINYIHENFNELSKISKNGILLFDFENSFIFRFNININGDGENLSVLDSKSIDISVKSMKQFLVEQLQINKNAFSNAESVIDYKIDKEYKYQSTKTIVETNPDNREENENLFFTGNKVSLFERFLMLSYSVKDLQKRLKRVVEINKQNLDEIDYLKRLKINNSDKGVYNLNMEIKSLENTISQLQTNNKDVVKENKKLRSDIKQTEPYLSLLKEVSKMKHVRDNNNTLIADNLKKETEINKLKEQIKLLKKVNTNEQ